MSNETLKISDKVTFTNDNGVVWPGHTITGFCEKTSWGAEVYIDCVSPWHPVKTSSLKLERLRYSKTDITIQEINSNLEIVKLKDTPLRNSNIDPMYDVYTLKCQDSFVMIKHFNGSTSMTQGTLASLEKFIKEGGFDENYMTRQNQTILFAQPFTQKQNISITIKPDPFQDNHYKISGEILQNSPKKPIEIPELTKYSIPLNELQKEVSVIIDNPSYKTNTITTYGCTNEVDKNIKPLRCEIHAEYLLNKGKTHTEVVKDLITKGGHDPKDIINAFIKYAPDRPTRSDEARKFAESIIRKAQTELKKSIPVKSNSITL